MVLLLPAPRRSYRYARSRGPRPASPGVSGPVRAVAPPLRGNPGPSWAAIVAKRLQPARRPGVLSKCLQLTPDRLNSSSSGPLYSSLIPARAGPGLGRRAIRAARVDCFPVRDRSGPVYGRLIGFGVKLFQNFANLV